MSGVVSKSLPPTAWSSIRSSSIVFVAVIDVWRKQYLGYEIQIHLTHVILIPPTGYSRTPKFYMVIIECNAHRTTGFPITPVTLTTSEVQPEASLC